MLKIQRNGWTPHNNKNVNQNLTNTGYRISKNGRVIKSTEKDAVTRQAYQGQSIKVDGVYHFLNRRQGGMFIYLQD